MGMIMRIVGALWALIGVLNLIFGFRALSAIDPSGLAGASSIVFNMVLFVLPGLVVAGIGQALYAKDRRSDDWRFKRGQVAKCSHCSSFIELAATRCANCGGVFRAP